jgi:hypothetical protein
MATMILRRLALPLTRGRPVSASWSTRAWSTKPESSEDNCKMPDDGAGTGARVEDEDQVRARVVDASLEHVPALGWSISALKAGAEDVGLSSASVGALFPHGPGDLVHSFMARSNDNLRKQMQALPLDE